MNIAILEKFLEIELNKIKNKEVDEIHPYPVLGLEVPSHDKNQIAVIPVNILIDPVEIHLSFPKYSSDYLLIDEQGAWKHKLTELVWSK